MFDNWYVEYVGSASPGNWREVYVAGFKVWVFLKNESGEDQYNAAGIYMNFEVYDHDNKDPLFIMGDDMWEEENPFVDDIEWGFMKVMAGTAGAGFHNSEIGLRTGKSGEGCVLFALGDFMPCYQYPYQPNDDWLWPGTELGDRFMTTRIKVQIDIPSMPEGRPPIHHRIHMVWRRFPTQDFYYSVELIPGQPLPPILAWCYAGLNEAPDDYAPLNTGFNINEDGVITDLERFKHLNSITFPEEMLGSFEPGNLVSKSRVMKPYGQIQELKIYDVNGLSVTLFAQPVIMELPQSQPAFEITNRELLKVTWLEPDPNDPNTWGYFKVPVEPNEGLYGIWGDGNDPCGFQGVIDNTFPYVYRVEAQSAIPIEVNNLTVTMELQALDVNNNVLNKMPVDVNLAEKSPDGLQIAGEVEWALTMVESLQGVYPVDPNGRLVVFYMPPDTHPRISWQKHGDYNSDNEVNVEDLSMFGDHWLPGNTFLGKIGPQNLTPLCDNWLLNDPNNDLFPDGIINFRDISVLAGMWDDDVFAGADNYNLSYEVPDPNLWDGQINFQDFAAFAESWLK